MLIDCEPLIPKLRTVSVKWLRHTDGTLHGRQLKGKYADITELKPGNFRFFGFRDGDTFFITNGARKDPKRQHRDYDFAVEIRTKYFERKLQADRRPWPKRKS